MDANTNDVLMARQPIYDSAMHYYGCELLFRSNTSTAWADFSSGDQATSDILLNLCTSFASNFSTCSGTKSANLFINFTRNLLLSKSFLPFDKDTLIVEVLEDMYIDDELIETIRELKRDGFRFALDDFTELASARRLIPYADIIKVDILQVAPSKLEQLVAELKQQPVILLAEKVEDEITFEHCKELGFTLFQGFFLERPKLGYGKKLRARSQNTLRLLSILYNEDVQIKEVAELVSQDAMLSFQLLRILNSPACRLPGTVESLLDAVVYLGLDEVKKWAIVMSIASSDNQYSEQLFELLVRARTTELCAIKLRRTDAAKYFTAGLISGISALLKIEKNQLLEQLPLSEEINLALLHGLGPLGELLNIAIAIQHCEWDVMISNHANSEHLIVSNHDCGNLAAHRLMENFYNQTVTNRLCSISDIVHRRRY